MINHNWSEPETLEPRHYTNEFGELVLTPVTEFMPASMISSATLPAIEEVLVTADIAEQAVLITENRRFCIAFCYPLRPTTDPACYAVKYSSSHRAAVCRVEIKAFKTPGGVSARQQIADMAPKITCPIPVF